MQTSSASTWVETVIGAAVVAVAVAFFAYAYKVAGLGTGSGVGGYTVIAEFDNAEGINVGTDVRLAGIKVGTVTAQSLNQESFQARVVMTIDKAVVLADDSAAKVTAEGLLGGKFIKLEPGGSDTKLAEGDIMSYTQGAVDIWALISQAMFSKTEGAKPAVDTPADTPAPQP